MARDTLHSAPQESPQGARSTPGPDPWEERRWKPAGSLLVRYSELGLKGTNRPRFESTLIGNLKIAAGGSREVRIHRIRGRLLLETRRPPEEYLPAVTRVFGVSSLSPARAVDATPAAIAARIEELCARELDRGYPGQEEVSFRVSVKRADKSFPVPSIELERELGHLLVERHPQLTGRMRDPELHLEVDIRNEGCWVFARREPGPGGLPVGSTGHVMALLSGGIDSPVAAWLAMKRGLRVDFLHFYSFPHVGPQSREKVIRQAENLSRWQPRNRLFITPFAEYQEAVRERCSERYWTVLFRRGMQRLASRLAWSHRCLALVTGDNLGQVASQTLENLGVIEEASRMPVLQPLITHDKQETISLARRIGSYEISKLPALDCCTVFQPVHPVLYGRLEEAHEEEAKLDLPELLRNALRATEKLRLPDS